MDSTQEKLVAMQTRFPDCTANRDKLRSLMSDYIPSERLRINVILNAYDEGIVAKLSESNDVTLSALWMINTLKDNYGITDENAFWAVETWCYIVGRSEVGIALATIKNAKADTSPSTSQGNYQPPNQIKMGLGIYKAGFDFPAGEIRLKVVSMVKDKDAQEQGVYYAILKKNSTSNEIITNGFIKTQAILCIKDGQRLEIGWQGEVELTNI